MCTGGHSEGFTRSRQAGNPDRGPGMFPVRAAGSQRPRRFIGNPDHTPGFMDTGEIGSVYAHAAGNPDRRPWAPPLPPPAPAVTPMTPGHNRLIQRTDAGRAPSVGQVYGGMR